MDQTFYTDGRYLEQNPTWDVEDSPWKAQQVFNILKKNGIKPTTVAEVGCGAGEILVQLQSKMPSDVVFFGSDISPQAIELAKKREGERLTFSQEDILQKNEVFNLMLAIDVFEHVDDYLGFLKRLGERAEYFVFHIPLDISLQSMMRVSPILQRRREVGHLHYFTKETALATLEDTRYAIVDWWYTGSSVDRPAQSVKSWLMRWPRKLLFWINPDLAVRVFGGYSLLVLAKRR